MLDNIDTYLKFGDGSGFGNGHGDGFGDGNGDGDGPKLDKDYKKLLENLNV